MKIKLLENKKVRYVVSGGTAFVIEYVCFVAILYITNNLFIANSISFIVGVLAGFAFHKFWTFSGAHQHAARSQTIATVFLGILNLGLTNVFIGTLVNALNFPPLIAKVIVILMIVVWNYIIFNKIIFKHRQQNND
jgi:putative flippase GtrA